MILNRVYLVVIPNKISRGIGVTTEEVGNTAACSYTENPDCFISRA